MSDAVVLTLRAALTQDLDAACIAPDRLAALGAREIAELPVWYGRRQASLGDFFDVRGEHTDHVRIEGDAARVHELGRGMRAGELVIAGDVGRSAGSKMLGGTLVVHGDVGDDAGVEMAGGVLCVRGRAGDNVGGATAGGARGMTGGEIIVRGAVGANAGALVRRGLIVAGGNAGEGAGRGMIAGTVIVFGTLGHSAALWSKRGTLVAMCGVDVPPTYRYACTYRPPHVALALTYLRQRYALAVEDCQVTGLYRRYSGDMAELGRGEILEWIES
jgi:formylmethanofuran dehydrogenase subunit C